jgi:hypothetical protein
MFRFVQAEATEPQTLATGMRQIVANKLVVSGDR